jgi:hypothetical protein
MNTYTDTQLKQALAKMLPEKLEHGTGGGLCWKDEDMMGGHYVLDTELLHICWLVEGTLIPAESSEMVCEVSRMHIGNRSLYTFNSALLHATWQQRTIALAKVKEIEIL